jgi:hypothetical protein
MKSYPYRFFVTEGGLISYGAEVVAGLSSCPEIRTLALALDRIGLELLIFRILVSAHRPRA